MNPTEQYDGHMFGHVWKILSKLRKGTKKIGLTHSVVLPTNPEWIIARIRPERLFTFVQYKATVMVLQSVQLCFLCIPHGQLFNLFLED